MDTSPDFIREIEDHKSAEAAPTEVVEINGEHSRLGVRLRGCFITSCELTDPKSERKVDVLHCEPNTDVAKLTASHVMMPVSKSEGVGGQHGYPRWADYHEFELLDSIEGGKRVSFQAMRSDFGPGLAKVFELSESRLVTHTIAMNYEDDFIHTSLGEHLYFSLDGEKVDGLLVDGKTLDESIGENAERDIMSGKSMLFKAFNGEIEIDFPSGHRVKLTAEAAQSENLKMIVWHRPGSESICFEPTLGFDKETGNEGLPIGPGEMAELTTTIELVR